MWLPFKSRRFGSAGSIFPDPDTRVYGVWGYPVRHTLSPALHNRAFQHFRMNALYLAFEIHPQDLPQAVAGARAMQFAGWNLTIPLKEAILPHLDLLSPLAQRIGAVNTVVHREGRLEGHNTDAPGFLMALKRHWRRALAETPVLLIGAGGAAKAVAHALVEERVHTLYLTNRTGERAERLWEELRRLAPSLKGGVLPFREPLDYPELKETLIVVNCTSRGLKGTPPVALLWHRLPRRALAFDLVYAPQGTEWIREAKRHGIQGVGGEEMLVAQAALAFELWTGKSWELRKALRWLKQGARQQA